MKNIITDQIFKPWGLFILIILGMLAANAQTPGIPYQAYITDTNGGFVPGEQIDLPLMSSQITLQFEIRDENGNVEYIEQKSVTTDKYGLISTVIGIGGTPVFQTFDDINWNGAPKKMYIDIDFSATGNAFQDHGEMDLIYIPNPGGGSAETATYLVNNNDGSLSYHNELGDVVTFSVPQHDAGDPNTLGVLGNKGNLYVDEDAGNLYMHGGTSWIAVNAENEGLSTGPGVPDATNPADPAAGDIYVDELSGIIYGYDGTTWVSKNVVETTTTLADNADGTFTYTSEDGTITTFDITQTGAGDPTTNGVVGVAGDVYVDETSGAVYTYNSTTNTWVNQSGILATNGLTVDTNNTVQLGGALIQPTAIDTDATNTLAITGLEDADITANDFDVMVVNQTTGVLQKLGTENLRARQYVLEYTAARGDDEFDTPKEIIELENVDAYRNGVRIDFVQVDADTIKLDLAETGGCYADDQILIVQLQ